jgi:glycosyltransferase involved in cell wall biosynthesis
MKICIVWKNDYPWDVRIEKVAMSLLKAGHDVHLLCSNTKRSQTDENINGIKVRRLPCINNRRLNAFISTPYYFNPFWFRMIDRTVKREGIELIIVRDLPLAPIALLIKKWRRIPLILDVAENYPAMYRKRMRRGGWQGIFSWLTKNPHIIEWIERYAVKHVDHLLVVVEESARRFIAMRVNEKKISIVSNTPDMDLFAPRNTPQGSLAGQDALQLIYVGFVQEGRGLDTVLSALSNMKETGLVKFTVIGDGDYLEPLKRLARQQQVEKLVEFRGWIKNTHIPDCIYASDIGVIPHRKSEHTDSTIPNKLFDFMACGKPVIVSNADPMKRIVGEEQCGLVFKSGDADDLLRVINRAMSDPDLLHKMGANGQRAVERKYNWRHDSDILCHTVGKFRK